ncbi:hypothetical protein [Streptomyces sp. NPDC094437]|uniref:hypothetical protein n=1 Tax=Streptomyces sp. NPDC094437 TaxID=3366060 RepID=UPI003817239D
MTEPLSRRHVLGSAAAAGAAVLFTSGTATAAGRRPAALAAPLRPGIYALTRPHDQFLSLEGGREHVVLLPSVGLPGVQEWQVQARSDGTVTLKNVRHGTYIGYEDKPRANQLIVAGDMPKAWALRLGAEPSAFHVVVPGGPVGGSELALDLSLLMLYPPRTALRPYRRTDQRQTWRFDFHG